MTYGLEIYDENGNVILTETSRVVKPAKSWVIENLRDASSGTLDFSDIPLETGAEYYAVSQHVYFAGFTSITPGDKYEYIGLPNEIRIIDPGGINRYLTNEVYKLVTVVNPTTKKISWTQYGKANGFDPWTVKVANGSGFRAFVQLYMR